MWIAMYIFMEKYRKLYLNYPSYPFLSGELISVSCFAKGRQDKNHSLSGLSYSVSEKTGSGCSKLTMSLVNEALKFQTFISQYANIFC